MRRSRLRTTLLLLTPIVVACDNPTLPIGPSTSPRPEAAREYLNALLTTMETYSINKSTMDWDSFRAQVIAEAGDAQSIPALYPAIELALRLLNDTQSYYWTAGGQLIGPAPVGGCGAAPPGVVTVPSSIAYVKIESCNCSGSAADRFAESIQQSIRTGDRPGLVGWIVDLRGNIGGNMWPMIAGVGPLVGEGIIGWIVYNDREYEREYRNGEARSFGDVFARVADPHTLLNPFPSVAVLTDNEVSSAAEAITVYFKGRPRTRSFGTPTCGHHHIQQDFALSDGATLSLAVSEHADRLKRQYRGSIAPDEVLSDPQEAVRRAVAWLQGGTP